MKSDYVICELCGREFGRLAPHLRAAHGMSTYEYAERFPNSPRNSVSSIEGIKEGSSRVHLGLGHSEVECKRIAEGVKRYYSEHPEAAEHIANELLGYKHTDEARRRMSESKVGQVRDEEARENLSRARQRLLASGWRYYPPAEVRQQTSETMRAVWQRPEHRELVSRRLSEVMKLSWEDPEFARRMTEAWNRKPNNSELQLQLVLDKYFSGEWEYVGDGKDEENWFEGRNPDFIRVNGRKQVIEMFGIYYHDPILFPNRPTEEELIAHYKKCGIDCLVLWEYDIFDEDEVVRRVLETRLTE